MQLKINTRLFLRNLHKGNSREQNQLVPTTFMSTFLINIIPINHTKMPEPVIISSKHQSVLKGNL